MSKRKQKLELTWVGKDERPKLEPRILIEDPELSYHADKRYGDDDIFDNILIQGDNLLALKALENDYRGKVKCIYIDPPFNTGAAFEHYDDGLEHSIWLGLMKERLEWLKVLLASEGVIIVHLDDHEAAYCKVLLDEVFGRSNYLNTISLSTNAPSGFKSTSSSIFSTANYLLLYSKEKVSTSLTKVFVRKDYDTAYNKVLLNKDDDFNNWQFKSIGNHVCEILEFENISSAKKALGKKRFYQEVEAFALDNPSIVFRTAAIGGGAKKKRQETISLSAKNKGQVFIHPNDDIENFYILNGEGIIFYSDRYKDVDGEICPAEEVTDMWIDIGVTGIASEGSVKFKNGKKPERLIRRCLQLCTSPGDLILDSFGGSGTTAAVAHKMGRRWITIEIGDHAQTHIVPRLKRVIDGEDKSGVTKPTGWKGGGGYRFYRLAPSLLEKDKYGRLVISKDYNPAMLSEAMCKLMGFTYAPSDDDYWNHGYAHDQSHIYVTTNRLTYDYLNKLSHDVGPSRSLLVWCKAFEGEVDRLDNLTVTKIPQAVLDQCEWGKDDYSLNVQNLPMAATDQLAKQQNLFGDDAGGDDA